MSSRLVSRVLGLAIMVVLIQGCQATSQYAGKTPVHINPQIAQSIENYFNLGNGTAFAIGTVGSGAGHTYCPHSRCTYKEGSAEKYAMSLCENHASACKIFAVNNDIVWEGPISLPTNNKSEYIVKLSEKLGAGRVTNWTGTSITNLGAQKGSLTAKKSSQQCVGDFDASVEKWSLNCGSNEIIKGSISLSEESLFWGRSNDGRYEISIARKGWPKLEEKVREHSAAYKPTISTQSIKEPSSEGLKAELRWSHVSEPFNGNIKWIKTSPKGEMSFINKSSNVSCAGEIEVWYGSYGTWKLECDNGATAEGSLKVKSGELVGDGTAKNGDKIVFRTGQ